MSFINYVRAGYPLLVVNSFEEFRVLRQYVEDLSKTKIKDSNGKVIRDGYKAFVWDVVNGVCPLTLEGGKLHTGEKIDGTANDPLAPLNFMANQDEAQNYSVLFLKDFHPFIDASFQDRALILRTIKNLSEEFKSRGKSIVFLSPSFPIPQELEKSVTIIDFKLPEKGTLNTVLSELCDATGSPVPKASVREALLDAAAGMTVYEAENAFSISLAEKKSIDPGIVRREKSQVVKKSGLLEVVEVTETLDDIGGLENLKAWIVNRKGCYSEAARTFGVKPAKGILLLGIPGGGKSLTAKALATALQRPLIRLDMGKIFGKYVGESENNMTSCLQILEGIAPCALWIDEIEKGLSGNKAGHEGHETTRRVFQMLLTWMQEKKKDVFLVATANSIDNLPPELLRAGRIDATFYVDLPDAVQREEIFKIHLRKAGRDPNMFNSNMQALMTLSNGFTGAEIEVWINEAVTRAFSQGHSNIEFGDLTEAIKEVTPIYKLQRDEIDANREKAKKRGTKWASIIRETTREVQGLRKVVSSE